MFVVDRIESDIITLENMDNETIINISKSEFIGDVKEGDLVEIIENKYVVNIDETIKRQEYMKNLLDGLWT